MCALNQSAVHYRADLSFSHRGKICSPFRLLMREGATLGPYRQSIPYSRGIGELVNKL